MFCYATLGSKDSCQGIHYLLRIQLVPAYLIHELKLFIFLIILILWFLRASEGDDNMVNDPRVAAQLQLIHEPKAIL